MNELLGRGTSWRRQFVQERVKICIVFLPVGTQC